MEGDGFELPVPRAMQARLNAKIAGSSCAVRNSRGRNYSFGGRRGVGIGSPITRNRGLSTVRKIVVGADVVIAVIPYFSGLSVQCEGDVREEAYRLIPYLAVGILAFLVVVFAYALAENLRVTHRWLERPYLFAFPAVGVIAALVAAESVRSRRDAVPFYMVSLIFAAAFGTLAISFWPYMIPFSITIEQAAAPHSSLAFMFWGEGLFVFPLMLLYTVISYSVFRGKVRPTADHY